MVFKSALHDEYDLKNLTIHSSVKVVNGFSVERKATFVYLSNVGICFNIGLPIDVIDRDSKFGANDKQNHVINYLCLTDGLSENIQGLFSLVEDKVELFSRGKLATKLKIFVSEKKSEFITNICKGIVDGRGNLSDIVEVIGISDFFKSYELPNSLELKSFPTNDENTQVGYSIVEKKKKLKAELADQVKNLKANEKKLFMQDENNFEITESIVFTFVRELRTDAKVMECNKAILSNSNTLCIGCSELQHYLGYNESDSVVKQNSTLDIVNLNKYVIDHFNGKNLILTYLPKNLCLDGDCDMYCFIIPRIPKEQRKKLKLLSHRPKLVESTPVSYTLEEIKEIHNKREWIEYETKYLDKSEYIYGQRGFYMGGGSQKAKKVEQLKTQYPRGYLVAYDFEGNYIDRSSAFAFYEDSYHNFLQEHPEILDNICENYIDVYDTEPSNILSGFDYKIQEQGKATHLQDIALRRAIKRLGREFKGKELVQVRGYRTKLFCLNPAMVVFYKRSSIIQPEITEEFMLEGSIESFWQSNKVILTPQEEK